jgi:hypothetical protein
MACNTNRRSSSSGSNYINMPQVSVIAQDSTVSGGHMDLSTQLDLLTNRMEDWSITNLRISLFPLEDIADYCKQQQGQQLRWIRIASEPYERPSKMSCEP